MPLAEVNRLRWGVEESGTGDPVVLVPGSWDDRRVWSIIKEDLARRFHVISFDRRGHDEGAEPVSRRDDEDDLADLITASGVAPAHVVGNAFGALTALGLAARRPELFRTLCAHEPPLLSLAGDAPRRARIGEATSPVPEPVAHGDPASTEIDLDALRGIDFPVLFTQGDQSPPFIQEAIARLAGAIDRAEVRTLPGVGNVSRMRRPAEYSSVLIHFMAR